MSRHEFQYDQQEVDEGKARAFRSTADIFYGNIANFVGVITLVVSFASPYWLESWTDTQSPFQNMGLWEFCFFKFRHPDYQFDHLFNGCHPLYGEEYRLIREKLLPGWLMVVQLFVTVALISSFIGQLVGMALLIRAPIEWILRFEHPIVTISMILNGFTASLLFLSVALFGSQCWNRDWLLYPNYNYVSWSYALALFACVSHIVATFFLSKDARSAKERKTKNKALLARIKPNLYMKTFSDFASRSSRSNIGSGYL